ncbi:MAG: hypothetical protein H7Y38_00190 [Armatimonadetes bacterium]|nr:hypothetical protein [Armatimonadota bacterium]
MTQKNNKFKIAAIATTAALGGMIFGQMLPAQAQVGEVIKGAAIAVLVNQFGGQVDRLVNTVTGNKPDGLRETTRVVPSVSIGEGAFVGAVQITGPKNKVDEVKAVARVEGSGKIGNEVRVTGLIPIATTKPNDISSISRIKGVGVSAIIDVKLGL